MKNKKKYYYHLTQQDNWGQEIVLIPRKDGDNRPEEELNWSKICVSDEIERCMTAIPFRYKNGTASFFIYRTKNKIKATTPPRNHGIFDISVTKEKWIRKKTRFVKIGKLDINEDINLHSVACDGLVSWSRDFYKKAKKADIKQYMVEK